MNLVVSESAGIDRGRPFTAVGCGCSWDRMVGLFGLRVSEGTQHVAVSRQHPHSRSRLVRVALLAAAGWETPVGASESDLATVVEISGPACPGGVVTVTVGYANLGPDSAATPYINVTIPSGVPATIDQLTQEQLDELEESAAGTDTFGNTPVLFLDSSGCEHLFSQLPGSEPV